MLHHPNVHKNKNELYDNLFENINMVSKAQITSNVHYLYVEFTSHRL